MWWWTTRKGRSPRSLPRGLLLQWHVTERCNLRCAHCYQTERGGEELGLQEQLEVLDQLEALQDHLATATGRRRIPTQITLTGGEPFLQADFHGLLDAVAKRRRRRRWRFAILTNGTLLDEGRVARLRRLRPRFVQVSVEGTESIHDRIRGRGSHARTVAAVRRLVSAGIPTYLSFTAHRGNASEFGEVARLGRRFGVARVWTDRLIPSGSGWEMRDAVFTPEETRAFFEDVARAREEAARDSSSPTEIVMHRALQFLVGGGPAYRCTAGRSLLTLLPNGDLLPCRRLPLRVGNVREKPLADLYFESELLRELRDPDRVAGGCETCVFGRVCGGGLRCLASAVYGDPFRADPGCWRAGSPVAAAAGW